MPTFSYIEQGRGKTPKAVPVSDPWSQRSGVSGGKALATSYGVGDPVKVDYGSSVPEEIDYSTFGGVPLGTTEKEQYIMDTNWSVGGVPMNKANYDNFWRVYNGVLKNGGTKGEAFRYAANDYNSRVQMGGLVITILGATALVGGLATRGAGVVYKAGSGEAEMALKQGTQRGLDFSGKGMKYTVKEIGKYAKKQAVHSAMFATAGQLSYGFISKFTNEWVPYYGKYKS